MSSSAFSRVAAIAANTFREALRLRLFFLLVLTGVLSLGAALLFRELNLGSSELRFIADFGFGAMSALGSIVAIVLTVQLFYGELERRTALAILARPVSRTEYAFGKLLGIWATIISFVAILALSLVLAIWIRLSQMEIPLASLHEMGFGVDAFGIVHFAALQCVRLVALACITAFFCSYATSSLFAVFMGFLAWILTQARSAISQHWGSEDGLAEAFAKSIAMLVPDLRSLEVAGALAGESAATPLESVGLVAYGLAYAALFAALTAMIFSRREI